MKIHHKLESDSLFVHALALCDVRLMNNQQYPWLILIPRIDHAIELLDLSVPQRHQLMDEISGISSVLSNIYEPDKLNVATLGNIVPQLHVHVIARYRSDPAWPSPVWGYPGTPYSSDNAEKTLEKLRKELSVFFAAQPT